jgi:ParB-like chromosome segregation protein Spo0J
MATYSKINYISPKDLKPYKNNTKKHPDTQIKKLVQLIENYGFPESKAILVDEDLTIIAGHGRQLASIKIGLKEVPYQIITDISEPDKKAIRIADNAVAESEWDYELLKIEYQDLEYEDFDLDLTCLDDVHLEKIDFECYMKEDSDNTPESSTQEIDPDSYEFEHKCPKCNFEFND